MPDHDVEFSIIYRGRMTIRSETERDAALIVERLNPAVLEKHTSSVEVIADNVKSARS